MRNETLTVELPEAATIRDLLDRLPLSEPERRAFLKADGSGLNTGMGVLVNRENADIFGRGLDTPLSEGSLVSLIHLLSGG